MPKISKQEVIKQVLLEDFILYLRWSFNKKYNTKIILKDFHIEVCEALIKVFTGEIKNLIVNMPPRSGKAHPLDEKVLTRDGFNKIGLINIGDKVISSNGKETEVTGVFPQGKLKTYTITFKDGRKIECSGSHLFEVFHKDWVRPKVVDVDYLISRYKKDGRRYKIRIQDSSEMKERKLQIDPYAMGLLLGDGGFSNKSIRFTNSNNEIIDSLLDCLPEEDTLSRYRNTNDYVIKRKVRSKSPSKTKEQLIKYGLFGKKSVDKFIPTDYLFNSIKNREILLNGLLDTDGDKKPTFNGGRVFNTSSEKLKDDFLDLARGLGYYAIVSVKESPKYTYKNETRTGKTAYRIRISKEKYNPIVDISESGEKECVCISVSANDSLYVAGEYVLTHNTELLNTFSEWTLTKVPQSKNIMTSYSDTLVTNNSQAIRDMIMSQEHQEMFSIETKKDSTAKKLWKTSLDGGLYAVSSFGQITGFGAGLKSEGWGGFIGVDDPLKPDDRESLLKLEKVKDWFETTLSNRKNKPDTPIIIIMQRLHKNDLVGCIENNEFGDLEDWTIIKVKMIDEDNRVSLWEEYYPYEKIIKIKEKNPSYFYSQFQQEPIIKGGNLLKTEWIKYVNREVLNTIRFDRKFITVDSALKDKEKNDYTVYTAFGVLDKKLYILDMYRGKPRSKERELTAKSFYDKHNTYPFNGMYIEQKASGIDLFQRMKDDGYMVFEVERNTDKIFRAENAAPYIETYGLHVAEELPYLIEMQGEYEAFPNATHDDIIDTIIDGVEICYLDAPIDYASLM